MLPNRINDPASILVLNAFAAAAIYLKNLLHQTVRKLFKHFWLLSYRSLNSSLHQSYVYFTHVISNFYVSHIFLRSFKK